MSKSLAASKDLMQTYLSELLTEEAEESTVPVKVKDTQGLEKLLDKVSTPDLSNAPLIDTKVSTTKAEHTVKAKTSKPAVKVGEAVKAPEIEPPRPAIKEKVPTETQRILKTRKSAAVVPAKTKKSYREGSFQAMFFDVAGLTIAVPLIELGGIHNTTKTTGLIGKPDWFKGVMLHREEKINVVDTALWVMPEKCNEQLMSTIDYQYIIMLNNSSWGLSAETLVDTVTLNQDDVKWLDGSNKRPWLAGLVKDRMCALLDVDSLIQLLEKGANITQE